MSTSFQTIGPGHHVSVSLHHQGNALPPQTPTERRRRLATDGPQPPTPPPPTGGIVDRPFIPSPFPPRTCRPMTKCIISPSLAKVLYPPHSMLIYPHPSSSPTSSLESILSWWQIIGRYISSGGVTEACNVIRSSLRESSIGGAQRTNAILDDSGRPLRITALERGGVWEGKGPVSLLPPELSSEAKERRDDDRINNRIKKKNV